MWYIVIRLSANERARISASVQRSRTLAMALRASTITRDRAGGEGGAILARAKRGDRGAGNGSEGTVEGAHDRADRDLVGRARESVPAALALLGVDETGVPEFGQDMIEELFRDRIGFGDVRHLSQFVGRQPRQMHHGLEAVLPLLREHDSVLAVGRRTPARS